MSLPVFGIDYAWGKVPYDALKRAGVQFAMRYISHDFAKDLDTVELAELRKRGIAAGLVFESTANRALAGHDAGVEDARFAARRCWALGLSSLPVYFGVDFDASDAQKPVIANYLRGAASVLGKNRVGVYGSYYVVKYMHDHNVCKYFWQTYAWSGGHVHPNVHIYQYSNGHKIAGLSLDFNHARAGDIGTSESRPHPAPKKDPRVTQLRAMLRGLRKVAKVAGGWDKVPRVKKAAQHVKAAIQRRKK